VVVSHDAFFEKIRQIQSLLQVANSDRTLLVLNLTFSFGWWVSLLTLFCGATLVMRSRFEPAAFLRTLIEQRISRAGMVPTMMRVLFSDAGFDAAIARANEAANLRQIWIGGEALGASLGRTIRARFSATELVDIYGLTETATCDFFAFPADYDRHPGSIGRPSPNVQFRISAEGELQLRTPYLMKGYLDEPELTAAALQDGWFRTGDLARTVTGGMVELQGRLKDVISRAGNKVTPAEIEQALCAHPDVAATMAVGVPDAVLGERIHVLLVARVGASLSVAALRRHLETRLERYKYPDAYYIGDALPLGRTGKADRAQLRTLVSTGAIAPLSP
jgi:long-chain acyl-CoA synthetase